MQIKISSMTWIVPLVIFNFLWCIAHARTFKIGVLLPVQEYAAVWSQTTETLTYAVGKINTSPSLKALRAAGHNFTFICKDTECNAGVALAHMVTMVNEEKVDVIIGPGCDQVCVTSAALASQWKVPMISFGCGSDILSDKSTYSTFVRTRPSYVDIAPALALVMGKYRWTNIAILSSQQPAWTRASHLIGEELRKNKYATHKYVIEFQWNAVNHIQERLNEVKNKTKVIIICAYNNESALVLREAERMRMFNGQYVLITFGMHVTSLSSAVPGAEVRNHFQGLLDLSVHLPRNEELAVIQSETERSMLPTYLDNAISLFGIALDKMTDRGQQLTDGTSLMPYLLNSNISFPGQASFVEIDGFGNAHSDVSLRILQNGSFVVFMKYSIWTKQLVSTNVTGVVWAGGMTSPPTDDTDCRQNNTCPNYWIIILSVIAGLVGLAALTVMILFLVRRYKKSSMLLSTQWKIRYDDLQLDVRSRSKSQFGSSISKGLGSEPDSPLFNGKSHKEDVISATGLNQIFTKVGYYMGKLVAVKKLNKNYIYVNKDMLYELNTVKAMNHTNLNQFIGATVEANSICVVFDYCSKGSLQDVLENDNIKLDKIFKTAFASDIAQGMAYIHDSAVDFHGTLKSSNVLLDNHWTCKISNFGLRKFREGERLMSLGDHAYFYRLMWTAPEHLKEEYGTRTGSKKGDVYSFAIILQEIVSRSPPFFNLSEDPKSVVDRVTVREHPVFRPDVPAEDAEEDLRDLMRLCWEEIPAFRPNFITIKDSLRKLNSGRQTNLVDQMMHMMEKYADHLEDLVEERTKQLAEEQQKTDELLCRMLPKTVAEELKAGRNIAPKMYGMVSIFFSDVVGFTSLAAASSPLQVVDFLNDLYTCFDTVIDNYDVYKVETIGDAYMVASGLPVPNGDRHAGEIGTMALDLLSAITTFKIRHMPKKQLQLRCGIHSGPVVAGVVGRKMPRYCLFGDTVNYASRMESSGLALQIHVSPECKLVLDQLEGYELVERGEVTMKGKGTITTYFLKGKKGYSKTLPDLSKAAGIEEHEFK